MNKVLEDVYHSSIKNSMTHLHPKTGTHGQEWVYAAKDMIISAIFATNKEKCFGDFSLAKGRNPNTGKPFVCERYKGAFTDAYSNIEGSIYILPGQSFSSNLTQWSEEVVSSEIVKIKEEIRILNMKDYLIDLSKKGELEIYIYPNRPVFLPKDDKDLIKKAHLFSQISGDTVWALLKKLHPHLMEKV